LRPKEKRQLQIVREVLALLQEYQSVRRESEIEGVSDGFMFKYYKEMARLAEELEHQHHTLPQSRYCKFCRQDALFMSIMPTTIGGVGTVKPERVADWYESRSLSSEGLCRVCEPQVAREIEKRGHVINQCMGKIQSENNRETLKKLCTLILEHAEYLSAFEKQSISTLDPPPSAIIQEYRELYRVLDDASS